MRRLFFAYSKKVGMAVYTGKYSSPLGEILLAGNEESLTGLWFVGQKYCGAGLSEQTVGYDSPPIHEAKRWLDVYFSGHAPDFLPPLAPEGSPFRRAVWDMLLTIPYGMTVTYGEIAARLAAKRGVASLSAQAVGGAAGHNPISLIIPCHRVVGADGSLTGYAGGVERKRELLRLEGVGLAGRGF